MDTGRQKHNQEYCKAQARSEIYNYPVIMCKLIRTDVERTMRSVYERPHPKKNRVTTWNIHVNLGQSKVSTKVQLLCFQCFTFQMDC